MPVVKSVAVMSQLMIVRRGHTERYRSLHDTVGTAPINATVIWDRRGSIGGGTAARPTTSDAGATPE